MSDDANISDSTQAPQPTKTKRRFPVSLALLVAALAVVAGGGSALYFMQRGHSAEASSAKESASSGPKYIVPLEGFTVNLADPEETHFFRVTMDLGLGSLPEGAEPDKVASQIPVARVRDAILSVLTLCKADALLTPEGKGQLKKNILDALHRSVPELDVRDVYFTEFLVQR